VAAEVAAACLWGPGAVPDLAPALRLAEKVVAADPKSYNGLHALGGLLLRAGRTEEAVKRLEAALAARGGDFTCAEELLLALASHRLGKAEEARRWRDRAAAWKEDAPRPPSVRLWVPALRREVDAELKKAKP
jgi:Flp pilus assembly protein TadD